MALGFALAGSLVLGADYLCDDAFISYRYAENLLAGRGLVFNPGERVDGYSSILWILLSALGMALGLDPVGWSRLAGTVCWLLCVPSTWQLARRLGLSPPFRWLACVAVACSAPGLLWAWSGLETAAAALACTQGLAWLLAARYGRSSWAFGIAFLLRPDAAVWWMAGSASLLWRRPSRRSWLAWCAPFLALAGAWWVWRTGYYGAFWPNVFFAKTGGGWLQVARGVGYVAGATTMHGLAAALTIPLFGRWREPRWRCAAVAVAAHLSWVAWVGGDWMPMGRFAVVALPAVAALAASSWQSMLVFSRRLAPSIGTGAERLYRFAVAVLFLLHVMTPLGALAAQKGELALKGRAVRRLEEAGRWIAANSAPSTLIAVNPAGALPYRSGRSSLDMTGLCDRHIASRPGGLHEKSDADYVLSRLPDIVVLIGSWEPRERTFRSTLWDRRGWPGEDEIFARPRFREEFLDRPPLRFPYRGDWEILLFRRAARAPGLPTGGLLDQGREGVD
jgi:hypothetical protein